MRIEAVVSAFFACIGNIWSQVMAFESVHLDTNGYSESKTGLVFKCMNQIVD
jgi:hypothetical protein